MLTIQHNSKVTLSFNCFIMQVLSIVCLSRVLLSVEFDDLFKVRKNFIYERARFNCRNQQSETPEQYIIVLHKLAKN